MPAVANVRLKFRGSNSPANGTVACLVYAFQENDGCNSNEPDRCVNVASPVSCHSAPYVAFFMR